MAQQDVNNIIQAWQGFHQVLAQKAALAQQQKAESDRNAVAQQQADSQEQERKDRAKQWQSEAGLREKEFQLKRQGEDTQRQLLIQRATENILKGIPLPGDTVAPQDPNMFTGAHTQDMHILPGMGPGGSDLQLTLPTPQQYASDEADRARIANAPGEEAKTREQAAAQQAETTRQLKLADQAQINKFAEMRQNNIYENNKQNNQINAAKALRDSENAMQIRKTIIEQSGGLADMPSGVTLGVGSEPGAPPSVTTTGAPDLVTNDIRDIRDGKTNTEDLIKKRGAKRAQYIQGQASQQGYTTLSKEQNDQLNDLNSIAQIVPRLAEMNKINADNPNMVNIPFTDAKKNFDNDKDIVGGSIDAITRILSGTKRFNNQAAALYAKSLIPDPSLINSKPELGFQKYNDFVTNHLQGAFNTITRNLPKAQQDIIRDRLGLNSLPSLNSAIKTPGMATGTPPGATPAGLGQPSLGATGSNGSGGSTGFTGNLHFGIQNGKVVMLGSGQ